MIGELGIAPFVDFGFMRRALVGCLALSLGATPVGVFLMLRRMSLTGDAMAHALLPGAALGSLLCGLSLGALTQPPRPCRRRYSDHPQECAQQSWPTPSSCTALRWLSPKNPILY
jgi:hypothetical protein